jgi:hypothetical protein
MAEWALAVQMRHLIWFVSSVSGLADSRETLRVMPAGAVRGARMAVTGCARCVRLASCPQAAWAALARKNIVYGIPVILAA